MDQPKESVSGGGRWPWLTSTIAGAVTSTFLIAHQVSGKAIRDTLFLSNYTAEALPWVMAASAILSVVTVIGLSRVMGRLSPARVLPLLCAASAAALTLEWAMGRAFPGAAAIAVYLHTSVVGPAVLSMFWSLINERYDPHSAKRAIAAIATGGTIGGVVGAFGVWRASTVLEPRTTLLFLGALHGACVLGTILVRAPVTPPVPSMRMGAPAISELRVLRKTPLLRQLGILVALSAAASALLDYVFSAQAAATYGSGPGLLSYFGWFWFVVSVLTFLLQLTLGRFALEKLGLAANIAVLPAVTVVGSVASIAVPGLSATAIVRGAEAAHHNTLFRSAYESLYTPLSEARKRAAKALIDVGFDRFGTVIGSILVFTAVTLAHDRAIPILFAVVVAISLGMLPVARHLHVAYLEALEEGLLEGAKSARTSDAAASPHLEGEVPPSGPIRPSQAPTQSTRQLVRTSLDNMEAAARDLLIERIETLLPNGLGELSPNGGATPGAATETLRAPSQLIGQTRDLLSGNVERARRELLAWPRDCRPIAGVPILLLAHEELRKDALSALRRVAPRITGQLVDVLLDETMDFAVRRRIPRVLSEAATQRAVDGLLLGMRDDAFEIRYECGRALMKLKKDNEALAIPRDALVTAIAAEREKCALTEEAAELVLDPSDDDALEPWLVEVLAQDRKSRSLEHIFTILSLHMERDPLRIAFKALHDEDERRRGTALEYLYTVLPTDIRDAVWPLLGGADGPLPESRSAQEILDELSKAILPVANGVRGGPNGDPSGAANGGPPSKQRSRPSEPQRHASTGSR